MTSFLLLGTLLALAAHLIVSLFVSVAVALAVPLVEGRLRRLGARARASALLALALLPSAAGLAAAAVVVAPAWIAHEPWGGAERPGLPLSMTAALGALLITLRLGTGLRALGRGARAEAEWTRRGVALRGLALPATRFEHELPVAALIGLLRPRLLLANRLVEALDGAELRAVAAHELGHLAGRDNLRRLLLAASPDPLAWTASGARLRRAFEEAAEAAADQHACALVSPVHLARALLKAAALSPPGQRLELALASFNDDGPLAARVRALVAQGLSAPPLRHGWLLRATLASLPLAGLVAVVVAASARPEVHRLLESIVRL